MFLTSFRIACVCNDIGTVIKFHHFRLLFTHTVIYETFTAMCCEKWMTEQCDNKFYICCMRKFPGFMCLLKSANVDIDYTVLTNGSDFIICKVTVQTDSPKDWIWKPIHGIRVQCEQKPHTASTAVNIRDWGAAVPIIRPIALSCGPEKETFFKEIFQIFYYLMSVQ